MSDIPKAECRYGYPREQLEVIFGDLTELDKWMYGQTMTICDGQRFDHDTRNYVPTGCGPHGAVVYGHDLHHYLNGGKPLD